MIPLHLTMAGFLSYRERAELDFTGFDLACIAGPNGAGKSSLLDAITWVLFGQARKRDDSLINAYCHAAEVSLIFAYENNIYRVLRAKPREKTALLEFHLLQNRNGSALTADDYAAVVRHPARNNWKPLTERTLRDTEARIVETLRLDYETFTNASFFLQGKADQFTQQRPGDRKRILASILGLEVWESYRNAAAERRRGIEAEIALRETQLREIAAELAEEPQRAARLAELEGDLERITRARLAQETLLESLHKVAARVDEQRRLVAVLGRQLEETVQQRDVLQRRLSERLAERESYSETLRRQDTIEAAYKAWQEARARLERWEEIATRFREHEKLRQMPLEEINTARTRLQEEKNQLQSLAVEIADLRGELPQVEARLNEAQGLARDAAHRLARRARLEIELREAQSAQAEAKAENPRLRKEMDELKERINQLASLEGANCPLCGQSLSQSERQALIDSLNAQGRELGDRFRANKELLERAEEWVLDLKAQIAELSRSEDELRAQQQEIARLSARLDFIHTRLEDWETSKAPRLAEITHFLETEAFAQEARARLAQIDEQLKAIGYDAVAHDADRQAEIAGRAAEAEMRALEKARAALQPLTREIEESEAQLSLLEKELNRRQQEYDQAAAALAEAEAQAPDVQAAERELLALQEQEGRIRFEVGAARQRVLVLEDLKKRRLALEAERADLGRQVSLHRQLERAFGKDGVPALLIEQALPEIEARANDILDRLSQGGMSVRFATQAAYKDKRRDDLRETLDILISDSAGTRDYELFSGGEAFRVDFAIRLALSEVLAQRAGARLQTLFIDEGFGSQDTQGRQRLIEAINLVRDEFAKILVITHIEELKEQFPTHIEVEKTPQGSTVRVY